MLCIKWAGVVATAMVLIFTVLSGLVPLSHDDVFWHIRTGEIVVEEDRVPTTDPFSHTRLDAPWVSHEWGYGVLLFAGYSVGGFAALMGLQVAFAIAIFVVLAVVLKQVRPGTVRADPLMPLLLALGLWAVHHELKLNPALITTLFLGLEILLLNAFRRDGRWRWVCGLAGMFLVWSNSHSGVLFGLMALGFWWIEGMARRVRFFRGPATPALGCAPPGSRFAILLAMGVITLVNPNGIEAPLYPFRLSLFLFLEDLPLDMGHFMPPTLENYPGFFVLAALVCGGLLTGRWRRLPIFETLGMVTFLVLSLRSNRFVLDFVVFSLPVLYRLYAPLGRVRSSVWVPVGVVTALLVSVPAAARSFEGDLVSEHFPQRAADFLEQEGIRGTLFNHQNYGGYLGWRLRAPIFWDGRNDVFGPLMKDLVGLSFDEIMNRWDVDIIVITERQYLPFRAGLESNRWGLAYWDDYCAVYLRRVTRFRGVLARHEYEHFPPFDVAGHAPDVRSIVADPGRLANVRRELTRVLSGNERAQRAYYYLGLLSLHSGDVRQASFELIRAQAIRPNAQVSRVLETIVDVPLE